MKRALSLVLTLFAITTAPAAGAAAQVPEGCARGSLASAARSLVHPGAEIAQAGSVAGFDSALVLEPLIYPGVRHRLVRAGELWCDGTGFNAAWRIAARPSDEIAMASAYAQVAAAPYFDGVKVTRAARIAPGMVLLETHALTNGVTARWVVTLDASGISRAAWTATRFAVRPFVAEVEGPTALPGLRRSYVRGAGDALLPQEPLIDVDSDPELVTEGRTADDFIIRVLLGETSYSPNAGMDTGVDPVDHLRFVRKVSLENYQEFYNWGLRKGWTSNVGIVYVNSSTAASCFACVFIRQEFNIHISSAVVQILFALGFEYPDDKLAFSNVLGHEMTHNWQNAYYKPTGSSNFSEVSFIEATARFGETIHSYSEVSHQPGSLIYSTGREIPGVSLAANSCNGWDGADITAAFANGPFTNKSYNACYFWLTWYPNHGTAGLVDMFTAMRDHSTKSGPNEVISALKQATGDTFLDDLAVFAKMSITGRGYTWASPGTTEPVRDWGIWLDRWAPAPLNPGNTASKTIKEGGMHAYQLTGGGWATLTATKPGVGLAVIRDNGITATHQLISPGDEIAAPAEGEKVWLAAIWPFSGSVGSTVGLSTTPPA